MKVFNKTDKQKEAIKLLKSSANKILLRGGSRSGKTFILDYAIFLRAFKTKSRHAILRYRFNHIKTSQWYDTIPKMLELCFPGVEVKERKQDWFYELPNGSTVWLGGLDDKERTEKILGNEYSTIYFNEISQISYQSYLMGSTRLAENSGLNLKLYFDCNPPSPKHWSYDMFIKKLIPGTKQSITGTATMLMNPYDNPNLPKDYIKDHLENLPERMKKRFLLGEFVDDVEGALWNQKLIDINKIDRACELIRIVVAIDPAVTSNKDSNETGIIVAGLGIDGKAYILEDRSGKYTPNQWARIAISLYDKHNADAVIGEVNNGGDMIETIIRSVDSDVNYKSVHASKGKYTRAEPIAGLYEQGKVYHVGELIELEEQMTTWNAQIGEKSPDRIDAMVWAVSELMLNKSELVII